MTQPQGAPPAHDGDPEMLEDEVLACAFAAWYDTFRQCTFKSEILRLPEPFVAYLMADGIRASPAQRQADDDRSSNASWTGGCEDDGSGESSADDDTEADFPELETQINMAIVRLGGSVLPKLNWSAPKDAQWLQSTLKCVSAREVITLLKASDFVAHDLCHSFDHCGTSRTRPDEFTLVLRRWRELHESSEFRCFVSDGRLFAISQRQTAGFFEHLGHQDEMDTLRREINGFFEQHIRAAFPLRRYVLDVYVAAGPARKTRLMDFSPWGPTTDPCLYDWPELADLAADASSRGALPELRVVREEAERRAKSERFSQLPLELAQLSGGEGLEDFIRKADQLLQQKGHVGGEGR